MSSTPRTTTTTRVAVVAALTSLLAGLAVAVAPVTPAEAAEEFLLTGRGNGHGILVVFAPKYDWNIGNYMIGISAIVFTHTLLGIN